METIKDEIISWLIAIAIVIGVLLFCWGIIWLSELDVPDCADGEKLFWVDGAKEYVITALKNGIKCLFHPEWQTSSFEVAVYHIQNKDTATAFDVLDDLSKDVEILRDIWFHGYSVPHELQELIDEQKFRYDE